MPIFSKSCLFTSDDFLLLKKLNYTSRWQLRQRAVARDELSVP